MGTSLDFQKGGNLRKGRYEPPYQLCRGGEGKGEKMTHNYQFQSVTLYLKNCRSYHEDCWYTGIKL